MDVGFVGLGRMGSGMASNLLKAGHHVAVYNRTPGKQKELVSKGAHSCARLSEACRGDVVITMRRTRVLLAFNRLEMKGATTPVETAVRRRAAAAYVGQTARKRK